MAAGRRQRPHVRVLCCSSLLPSGGGSKCRRIQDRPRDHGGWRKGIARIGGADHLLGPDTRCVEDWSLAVGGFWSAPDGSGWGCGVDGKCGTLCRRRRDGARHRLYCLHRLVYGRGKSGDFSCRQFRSGHSFQLHAQLPMVVRSNSGRSATARLASIWAVPHRLPYGAFSPRRCFGNRNRCLGLGA